MAGDNLPDDGASGAAPQDPQSVTPKTPPAPSGDGPVAHDGHGV